MRLPSPGALSRIVIILAAVIAVIRIATLIGS